MVFSDPCCVEPYWVRVFVAMVCCNGCHDRREAQLWTTDSLHKLCSMLLFMKPEKKQARRGAITEALVNLTKQYALAYDCPRGWNENIAGLLLDNPNHVGAALYRMRQAARGTGKALVVSE